MSSLRADFDELRERIRHGREFGHASFEPIYYLIFSPEQILEVKRQTPAWQAKLHQEGWEVQVFSMAENLWEHLHQDPFWPLCVQQDKASPGDWARTNLALADIVANGGGLLRRLGKLCGWKGTRAHCSVTPRRYIHLPNCVIESQLQGKSCANNIFTQVFALGRHAKSFSDSTLKMHACPCWRLVAERFKEYQYEHQISL